MAFDSLSERLTLAMRNIAGKGKLTDKNMDKMFREIRTALLEADVNYDIADEFIRQTREAAKGAKVTEGLEPADEVVRIVHQRIIEVLGTAEAPLTFASQGVTKILMIGLQGTGKTTSAAKLAKLLRDKQGRKPLLAACDVKRPAAIEQLQALGRQAGIEVFSLGPDASPLETAKGALAQARAQGYDTLIIDTAGRLAIDDELMGELQEIKRALRPEEVLLTVDSMTGQSIVETAKAFQDKIGITGLLVTKFDSDARGGGVFSVRAATGVPVKLVGTGEKLEDIDVFYPDRMAGRILGMGDVLTLIEQAEAKIDVKESEASAKRMMAGQFTLDDMLVQFKQMRKLGSLSGLMKMIPGLGQYAGQINDDDANARIKKQTAIILSMTPSERRDPKSLRGTHKNRIAKGSGTSVDDVNQLINAFERTKKQMGMMGSLMKGRYPGAGPKL